eukprot:gnl/TRDRNA2_/TRDRNA2_130742_c0_seq1.p1 gnl/TRDRNA2_/TRDRNA2_130742_c0~~gnl/TRDRNA2_/TRDRNA2_130742_c0_seq1.p1  ORF type:complete len:234 (-),score=38.17 gnl/TRDRNA2_/TRDRNA2_130742_c0_seq1:146-772(-)
MASAADVQLCTAARAGQAREVEALLDMEGASVNAVKDGLTPLMYACMADGHQPFERSDKSGQQRTKTVEVLLDHSADVHLREPVSGWTALFFAGYYAQDGAQKLLIKAKADVNGLDNIGRVPLTWTQYGNIDKEHQKLMRKELQKNGLQMSIETRVKQNIIQNEFHCPLVLNSAARRIVSDHKETGENPQITIPPPRGPSMYIGGKKK